MCWPRRGALQHDDKGKLDCCFGLWRGALELEHGEAMSRFKLRTCNALFNALDSVTDSVEISNDEHEIQVSYHQEQTSDSDSIVSP